VDGQLLGASGAPPDRRRAAAAALQGQNEVEHVCSLAMECDIAVECRVMYAFRLTWVPQADTRRGLWCGAEEQRS